MTVDRKMFDADGMSMEGTPAHLTRGWDNPDPKSIDVEEYVYSVKGEGWMQRRDFERKYSGGEYPFE